MSLDYRTRVDSEPQPMDASGFFRDTLPARLDAHQAMISPAGAGLKLRDFCIETDGEPVTLSWCEDRVEVKAGNRGRAHVRLTSEQLAAIVTDQSTPIALMSNALLDMPEGGLPDFLNWWLVLRAAIDGRRIYAAGDLEVQADGVRTFTPEDSDAEMRAFLEEAGYLHIRGLFSAEEMAAVEADYEVAAPTYEKGDPRGWFATTQDGVEHLVRMEGFERHSDAALELTEKESFKRIGDIPGIGHQQRRQWGYRVSALRKPIGVVKGISDVPWHKDCSLGRHSYECCNLTVGISVNGADAETGQLRVVPGSHRALIWPSPCLQPGLDLKPVDLPTATGDVTVHLSCTLHMSQPPVTRGRKVLYTGFGQKPVNPEAAAANRNRLTEVRSKTHTTVSQAPGYLGDKSKAPRSPG